LRHLLNLSHKPFICQTGNKVQTQKLQQQNKQCLIGNKLHSIQIDIRQ